MSKRNLKPDDFVFERNSFIRLIADYSVSTLFPVNTIREMKVKNNSIFVFVDFNLNPLQFPVTKFNDSEYNRYMAFYSVK